MMWSISSFASCASGGSTSGGEEDQSMRMISSMADALSHDGSTRMIDSVRLHEAAISDVVSSRGE